MTLGDEHRLTILLHRRELEKKERTDNGELGRDYMERGEVLRAERLYQATRIIIKIP